MSDNVQVQICSRKGEWRKESEGIYSYTLFHVGLLCVCSCMCLLMCACVVWVFLPPETLQTGACLTGSQICLFLSADLFRSVFHTPLKQQNRTWQENTSFHLSSALMHFKILYTEYCQFKFSCFFYILCLFKGWWRFAFYNSCSHCCSSGISAHLIRD